MLCKKKVHGTHKQKVGLGSVLAEATDLVWLVTGPC